MNTTLLNFRAPNDIKDDFMKVCKLNCTTMTSEFVKFMLEFISEGSNRVKDYQTEFENCNKEFTNSNLERHGNLIKDPVSGTWVSESDWRNNYES